MKWFTAFFTSSVAPAIASFNDYMTSLNPYLWLKVDETTGTTATDSGSGGNDGTYEGTVTLGEDSLLTDGTGTSVLLGSDGKINLGNVAGLSDLGTTGYTMMLVRKEA